MFNSSHTKLDYGFFKEIDFYKSTYKKNEDRISLFPRNSEEELNKLFVNESFKDVDLKIVSSIKKLFLP